VDELLADPGLGAGEPARLGVQRLKLRVLVEGQEADDPARERAALQDLELGLILRLLVVGLLGRDHLLELEDARLLLVDAKRRDGGEERSGRERPDRAHDDREQEERDDRPAVADQHPPVVPEMRILFRDRVSPDGGSLGGQGAARGHRVGESARLAGRRQGARVERSARRDHSGFETPRTPLKKS
jgi:hypothetical protein